MNLVYIAIKIECTACNEMFNVYAHKGSIEFAVQHKLKANSLRSCPYCDNVFKRSIINEVLKYGN
jgi:uncharacterized pyridoxamine 5'-phosphate oxidase family protein